MNEDAFTNVWTTAGRARGDLGRKIEFGFGYVIIKIPTRNPVEMWNGQFDLGV